MLSSDDKQLVVDQIKKLTGSEEEQYYVESYLKAQDVVRFDGRDFYALMLVRDERILEGTPPEDVAPLLFTDSQIEKAKQRGERYKDSGDLNKVAFICTSSPRELSEVSKEEEESAVAELVLEHYSSFQLFKLWVLSLFR